MPRVRSGFLVEFAALKEFIGRSRNADAGRTYVQVKRLIEKGDFSSIKYDGEMASFFLAGYDDEYISSRLNIALSTVRGHRKRICDALCKVFGDDFCQLFYDYEKNEKIIKSRIAGFRIRNVSVYDLFPRELLGITSEKDRLLKFDLKDCADEISFFERHCFATIDNERDSLDMNKLAYVLDVVNGLTGSTEDRNGLLTRFLGGLTDGEV